MCLVSENGNLVLDMLRWYKMYFFYYEFFDYELITNKKFMKMFRLLHYVQNII